MHIPDTSSPDAQLVEERDEAGRLQASSTWMGGLAHGPLTRYGAGGDVLLQAELQQGRLAGALRVYDEQGALLRDARYVDGKLHGEVLSYRDGKLASSQHFHQGIPHGVCVLYAPSGLEALRQTYLMGKLDGVSEHLQDKVVVRRETYQSGTLEGDTREYSPDGALLAVLPYRAGVLHGVCVRYGPDGALQAERRYVNGVPAQPWRLVAETDAEPVPPSLGARLEKWVRG